MQNPKPVSNQIKLLFLLHFALDIIFAVPLFIFPIETLGFLGWMHVDPFTTRVVAAALFGIGIQSMLSRNAERTTYLAMLSLKLIWSFFACLGILISAFSGGPVSAWLLAGIFGLFFVIWAFQYKNLNSIKS